MVTEMRIPSHITALYIFSVVNLLALFHVSLVDANIIIIDGYHYNETIDIIERDKPAGFGPPFPSDGLWGHIVYAVDNNGCKSLPAPPKHEKVKNTSNIKWISIIRRHGCNFDVKVWNAQQAGYSAALIHNVGSNDLVPMGAGSKGEKVEIPSAFIGQEDAMYLKENFDKKLQYTIIIDNRVPFNANLYLLPFAIVVGICFILMVVFMVAKWIRDHRRRRRSRLSKANLKKIPVKKFKKGDPYDVCAICLDEYEEGEKLRILPCAHAYHMKCIDPWLTKNKRTCPVCKRKVIPGEPDSSDSESESDGEANGASENTPLLSSQGGATGGRNRSGTFENSGLPATVRNNVNLLRGSSSTDSDSDGGGVQSSGTFQNSLADVHVPSTSEYSRSPGSANSYGATAVLKISNEAERSGSINSAYRGDETETVSENNDELLGAVGGVPDDIPDTIIVDPHKRLHPQQVDFVDDYYREETELKGVLSGEASNVDEPALDEAQPGKKKKKEKKDKPTTLPKKPSKKKKRRRDEVA